jgi:ABC-type oligopeptide transport system substrate-binding subunit
MPFRLPFLLASLTLLLAAALPASAQDKVLRFAFPIAETGFDPAQINDLYSSIIVTHIFDSPLRYDFLARPVRVVPSTADGMPEVSPDYTTASGPASTSPTTRPSTAAGAS